MAQVSRPHRDPADEASRGPWSGYRARLLKAVFVRTFVADLEGHRIRVDTPD